MTNWNPEFAALLVKRIDHMERNASSFALERAIETRDQFTWDVCGTTRMCNAIKIIDTTLFTDDMP